MKPNLNTGCSAEVARVIRNLATNQMGAGWVQLLLAGAITASLSLVPAVHAEEGADMVPPPPPGPYAVGTQPRYRPDTELDSATSSYPPGMPQDFRDNRHQRPNRQEFMARQEQRRKQMDREFKAHEEGMQERIEAMQKRMDKMTTQGAAGQDSSAPDGVPAMPRQMPDPEMQQQWEKRKAEQDQRWQQQRAEQEKRREQMQAEHEQRTKSMYRQEQPPVAVAPETATAPAQAPVAAATRIPVAPAAPAYSWGQPVRPPVYGYGYPPPPYGYGAPPPYGAPAWGGGYVPYPAAPAGAWNR